MMSGIKDEMGQQSALLRKILAGMPLYPPPSSADLIGFGDYIQVLPSSLSD